MTQAQIEALTNEEYTHLLSYGEPVDKNVLFGPSLSQEEDHDHIHLSTNTSMGIDSDSCLTLDWIGTLDSTTYPGLTFGYHELMGS